MGLVLTYFWIPLRWTVVNSSVHLNMNALVKFDWYTGYSVRKIETFWWRVQRGRQVGIANRLGGSALYRAGRTLSISDTTHGDLMYLCLAYYTSYYYLVSLALSVCTNMFAKEFRTYWIVSFLSFIDCWLFRWSCFFIVYVTSDVFCICIDLLSIL